MRRAACGLAIAGCAALVAFIRTQPLALHETAVRAEIAARAAVRDALADDVVRDVAPAERAKVLDERVSTWIADHPADFAASRDALAQKFADYLRYRGDDGRDHAYLGGADSYTWLRAARNQLRRGTPCDAIADGQCRDALASAPVGTRMKYGRSLHIAAITALHGTLSHLWPGYPLPASAFWVQVIAGVLGVVPAFLVGRRLGGVLGGLTSAAVISLQPMLLIRSLGGDNDVWNVVLPCTVLWALLEAYASDRRRRQLGFAALAGIAAGLHAANWRGWVMLFAVVVATTLTASLWRASAATADVSRPRPRTGNRALAIGILFALVSGALAQVIAVEGGGLTQFAKLAAKVLPHPKDSTKGELKFPRMTRTVAELQRPSLRRAVDAVGGPSVVIAVGMGIIALAFFAGRRRRELSGSQSIPLESRVLVFTWLAVAAYLTATGMRFAILLAPPAGACAAAVVGALQRAERRRFGKALGFAAAIAVIGPLVWQAQATARGYIPAMNDAWWDTFTSIRDNSPPESIVNVWWDYGYWAKFLAERGVTADGGTLGTHASTWLARALIAPTPAESAGVLRMLNCGNDAIPTREGQRGALAKLTAHLDSDVRAYQLLRELTVLDRVAARARLAEAGLDSAAQDDVLASTHCEPPPSFVVVTDEQLAAPDVLLHLGTWDAVSHTSIGLDLEKLPPLSPPYGRSSAWLQCGRRGGHITCPVGLVAGNAVLDAFVYDDSEPSRGVFSFRRLEADGPVRKRESGAPAAVIVAGQDDAGAAPPTVAFADVAVLVDAQRQRILVGHPAVLRSTLLKLIYLDGRGAPQFEKIDERTAGYRVLTYRLHW